MSWLVPDRIVSFSIPFTSALRPRLNGAFGMGTASGDRLDEGDQSHSFIHLWPNDPDADKRHSPA